MNINRFIFIILTLLFLMGCSGNYKKLDFKESDKSKIVLLQDLLSKEYLNTIELKDNVYEKGFDSASLETKYKYDCEFWKNNSIIGGFISFTYEFPYSEPNEMEDHFLFYIAGQSFASSPDFSFKRTEDFSLPFQNYRVYEVYKSDTLNFGLRFNILNENKIFSFSIFTFDNIEIQINQLVDKISDIE